MKALLAAAFVLALGTPTVDAAALTAPQEQQAIAYAINNSIWVLYHETGHLFIDQFELPVLGVREEDAADAIATLMLLDDASPEAEQALRDSVDGWFEADLMMAKEDYDKADFYDEHALDIQRAFSMVCLMVGKDYLNYRKLAADIGLGVDRVQSCEYDYDLAERSWTKILRGHLNKGAKPGPEITVKYDTAKGGLRKIADFIRADGLLERVAALISERYALRRPVTFRAMSCGEANSFYEGDSNEVQFCYEYAEYYYDLMTDRLAVAGEQPGITPVALPGEKVPNSRDKILN